MTIRVKCPVCPRRFDSIDECREHRQNVHQDGPRPVTDGGRSKGGTEQKNLVCGTCGTVNAFERVAIDDGENAFVLTMRCTECGDSSSIGFEIPQSAGYDYTPIDGEISEQLIRNGRPVEPETEHEDEPVTDGGVTGTGRRCPECTQVVRGQSDHDSYCSMAGAMTGGSSE